MATLIADEIIPRLIAAHRTSNEGMRPEVAPNMLQFGLDPVRLADEAVASTTSRLLEIGEAALEAGLSFESLLVDAMSPAARILGERWERDETDFVEVTLGLWRLQELIHLLAVSQSLPAHDYDSLAHRRVLCAVAPGDDHSFGSVMMEEMFRRAGWSPDRAHEQSLDALRSVVRAERFDLIALTVSVERNSALLADVVSALRAASCNPHVRIMVGGPVFNERPGLWKLVGADGTASDARAALQKAEMLVGQLLVGQTDAQPWHRGTDPLRTGLLPD